MNSKDKGNIGEAIILAEFVKRNIQVSIPFGDNARYDLIAEFNGKLNKIQVKYCNQKITESGSISCPCASSTNHTTNKGLHGYENDVDFLAFYLVEWNVSLLVPIEKINGRRSINFRKTKPIFNNQWETNLIQDYTFAKFFGEEEIIEKEETIEEIDNKISVKKEIQKEERKTNKCIDCGKLITSRSTRCNACASKIHGFECRKVEHPDRETLKNLIRATPFVKIAEQYGVSDKAITKWCISENLPSRKKDINNYTDEEWEKI